MPSKILKNLYIAKSLAELNQRATDSKSIDLKSTSVRKEANSLVKVYNEAHNSYEAGDEERAYILYMRFCDVYQKITKTQAYKRDSKFVESLLNGSVKMKEALTVCETLSHSLKKRYAILQESEKALESQNVSVGNQVNGVNSDKNDPEAINDLTKCVIEPIQLYECIESSSETPVLLIDIRPVEAYNDSHMTLKLKGAGDVTIINISEDLIEIGLTAAKLEKILSFGSTLDAFNRRRSFKKIVMMDWFSTEVLQHSKLSYLHDALWKWDQSPKRIKYPPILLKGGYESWTLTFPMHTTNPKPIMPNRTTTRFPIIKFNYDFNEETEKKKPEPLENGTINGFDDVVDTTVANAKVTNMFTKPSTAKVPGTARLVMPTIPDRSTKPKITFAEQGDTVSKVEETAEISAKFLQEQKEDLEKIRLRKQMEASEEMKLTLQQKEEDLANQVKQLTIELEAEKEKRLTEENLKMRQSSKKNGSKRSVSESETGNIQDVDISEVNKRFTNENENNSNEERAEINGHLPKTNGEITFHVTPANEEIKMPSTPKQKSSSQLSVGGSLSRSVSSPNIAQLLAEEENRSAARPQVNRSLKPTNRENFQKLFESTNVTVDKKIRDFSPFFASTPGQSVTGLRNLGNTCFMNAAIQCLVNTPQFVQFFGGKFPVNSNTKFGSNGELALELSALIRMMMSAQYKSLAPKDFRNAVSRHWPLFSGNDQQDSHEFLVWLFEKLHADVNVSKASTEIKISEDLPIHLAINKFWNHYLDKNNSIISQLFEGLILQTLTCLHCNKTSNTFEVFSFLSLPIATHRCTVTDCLQMYLKPERMSGDTAFECATCKQKRDADKKIVICKLPKILLIHLKRFSYEGLWRQKLQTFVEFPIEDLNLKHHRSYTSNEANQQSRYNLYGVINHYGTLEGGHYTAVSKNPQKQKWYKYDDQEVTPITQADVKTQAAYILFYVSTS